VTETPLLDCLLTLALPAELEEEMIDLLRGLPELVSGFTLTPAEGLGSGAALRSTVEQVRGRARRRLVQVLLPRGDVPALLEALRAALPSREVAWWTTDVTGFGRLA
jgi:hypothetical protein